VSTFSFSSFSPAIHLRFIDDTLQPTDLIFLYSLHPFCQYAMHFFLVKKGWTGFNPGWVKDVDWIFLMVVEIGRIQVVVFSELRREWNPSFFIIQIHFHLFPFPAKSAKWYSDPNPQCVHQSIEQCNGPDCKSTRFLIVCDHVIQFI